MITKAERQKIIAALGYNYVAQVLEYLATKEIVTPRTNNPYDPSAIRHMVNGNIENLIVEDHIVELALIKKKERAEYAKKRKKLLES